MLAMAGDEGLEPSYLDLETSVLAAGRISRKIMAELTGVEPVPAERQSAILPIDDSSGSLPWTRTTISAFRARRPSIGRRGNFKLSKNWLPGSDANARIRIQSPESCHQTTRHQAFSGIAFMHRTHNTADSSTLWPSRMRSVRARSANLW